MRSRESANLYTESHRLCQKGSRVLTNEKMSTDQLQEGMQGAGPRRVQSKGWATAGTGLGASTATTPGAWKSTWSMASRRCTDSRSPPHYQAPGAKPLPFSGASTALFCSTLSHRVHVAHPDSY